MDEITEPGTAGIAGATKPVNDHLRLGADFPDPPPPPPTQPETPPEPPKTFVREIDLKDGSGVQRFEAESWEALVDKLASAQENATRKIRELSKSSPKPIEPEKTAHFEELKPKQLSDAEVLAIREGLQADPLAAFSKLFEAQTGISPEQYRNEENARRQARAQQEAEREFVMRHKEDFVPNADNSKKIYDVLRKEELPITKKNLEWAFQQVRDEVGPRIELPPPPPPPVTPPVTLAPNQRPIAPPPVTIPANFGARPEAAAEVGGIPAAEYAQIATLPPAEMKARIEQLFRQGRTVRT